MIISIEAKLIKSNGQTNIHYHNITGNGIKKSICLKWTAGLFGKDYKDTLSKFSVLNCFRNEHVKF